MEIRAGASTALNIKMLIEPLHAEAASLTAVALRSQSRREGRWHATGLSVGNRVQLQVFPFTGKKGGETHCLVAINSKFEEDNDVKIEDISDEEHRAYVERMELEIRATQEALQQTIEELRTANEELQSTNEELQISSAERQALASIASATMASWPARHAKQTSQISEPCSVSNPLTKPLRQLFGLSEIPPTGIHLSQCNLPVGFPALAPIANTVLRVQETRRMSVLSEGKYYSLVISPVHDQHRKLIGLSRVIEMMSDISHVVHWSYDLETEELFWSPEMFSIYGCPDSGQMPSWSDTLNLVHPEDRKRAAEDIDTLLQDGGSVRFDRRIFGPSGHIVSISGKTTLIKNSEGEASQLIGAIWDTADETERNIRLSSLESVQDELGIGFFSFDVENNTPQWNRSMFDILGYDPIVHVPSVESLLQTVHPDTRGEARDRFQGALEHGQAFRTTLRVTHADGSEIGCECKGQVRRRADSKVSHVFGSLRRLRNRQTQKSASSY